ncbi:MGMT family protein [Streptomyces sp. CA-181903]|uniref:MGMT family protein n=1 Tax=Streptomyces sp. CA-181903 TaxID=3240055 RepID=UPI003D92D74B
MDRVTEVSPPSGPHAHDGRHGLPEDPAHPAELPEYAERVLAVAETIPPGRVMTYGDVAEWLGEGGPRQVGRVMALYGGAVPWWRVVRADGVFLPGREQAALGHYREEGTPLRTAGPAADGHVPRIAMARARWDGLPLVEGGDEEDAGADGVPRSGAKGARGGASRVKRAT